MQIFTIPLVLFGLLSFGLVASAPSPNVPNYRWNLKARHDYDDGYAQPSYGYASPTDGYASPTDSYSYPTGGYSTPTDSYSYPTGGYSSGYDGYASPSGGYAEPSGYYDEYRRFRN